MKTRIVALIALASLCWLYIGYYESLDDANIQYKVFIKKHPTLQVRFDNIFANSQDPKPLEHLSDREKQLVRDYCRFRLGIETRLETQAELERCEAR
ncbi:hypothetical protein [Pseudomonas panipatensis]|uniref:hypothetical protein n=1 Tax=Pseudomonas panipatensis TaxID=428992 RepID=UPI0035B4257F